MENGVHQNGSIAVAEVGGNGHEIQAPTNITIKGALSLLMANTNAEENNKEVISLGIGDPTAYSCFRTTVAAQEAVVNSLRSYKFNGYSPTVGLPQTRKSPSFHSTCSF